MIKKTNKKEIKNIEIDFSNDVKLNIENDILTFEKSGKKVTVKYNPVYLDLKKENNKIILVAKNSKKQTKAVINTTQKHIINAIKGLEKEYVYKLAIVYSHFPMSVKVEGENVVITNFLGEKKPRVTKILPSCKVEVKGREIFVKGPDKYNAGQTAGNIEKITKVLNKDFRIFDDGCYIVEKAKQE